MNGKEAMMMHYHFIVGHVNFQVTENSSSLRI